MTAVTSGTTTAAHETVGERRRRGKALRKRLPRSRLAEWTPGDARRDPVALLEEQNATRLPWLVPVRRGRMAESAFTFYRAAARLMATDLASTPVTGLTVQACGDAHLSNFGAYASPERRLVFDVNDFDETLPGPWEWDVKRLVTSVVIAARDGGMDRTEGQRAARRAAAAYRDAIARFARMSTLDVWYASLPVDELSDIADLTRRQAKRLRKFSRKARSKDSLHALSKLAEEVDGVHRIRRDPPLLVPLRDLPVGADPDALRTMVEHTLATYRSSLADNRRQLLDRFRPVDIALKVVGVGSVGTRCLIVLLQGRNADDPLFLQVKEATASVLEEHLPPSAYDHHGERVVRGQRLMQSASDIFLGWTRPDDEQHFYVRQLKDWKGSFDVDDAAPEALARYAELCGWTLARAHARTGDPIAIAGYLGSGDRAIASLTEFGEAYADQNARDHQRFVAAIAEGRLEAADG